MILARGVAICAALLGVCVVSSAAAPSYTIAGVVVEHVTNRPVERVLVMAAATDGSRRQSACLSEANGAFRIENLAPGKYTLTAERPGGLPETFQGSEGFVTGIAVGPGRDSDHIVFPLIAGARLSGTVVDQDGEPVQNAQLYLFRKGVFGGSAQINLRANGRTDKGGRFHFTGLPEGTYYLAVAAQPWYSSALYQYPSLANAPPELSVTYPVTYYAGAVDPNAASAITLTEGASTNIQVALQSVPALNVPLDETGHQGNRGIGAQVSVAGPGGHPIMLPQGAIFRNGHLELVGIAAGGYTVTVQTFGQGRPEIISQKHVSIRAGSDAVVSNEPAAAVTGRVVFNPPDRPPEIQIALFSASARMAQRQSTAIHQDGSFQFDSAGLPPGHYRVQLLNAPEFRITNVRAKGAGYDGNMLELSPGASAQLSVLAGRAESRLEGVAWKDGKPFAGAMVLLLPADPNTGVYIGRDQSDSDGTFAIPAVPAGRYVLLAIDDGRDLPYRDRAIMEPYRKEAQSITVPVAQGSQLKVNVLTRQR